MKLVPDTPLKVTIAVAITVISATATISWICANGLRDIKQEIADLRADVNAQGRHMWTIENQKDWVYALDRANRFSSIEVPQIGEVKPQKKPN